LCIEYFDDNNELIIKKNEKIDKDCFLVREEKSIKTVNQQSEIKYKKKEELICHIRITKDHKIKIENPINKINKLQTEDSINILNKKLWYIIDLRNNYYSLCEGDIIQLGDIKYIVHEIYLKPDDDRDGNVDDDNDEKETQINDEYYICINKNADPYYNKVQEIDNYKKCKFSDHYNICLCTCKNELIHSPCLRKYIKIEKSENENHTITSYFVNNCFCKKCKTIFPIKFEIKGKKIFFNIVDIERPTDSSYIIF
jgi:hypothetical protein